MENVKKLLEKIKTEGIKPTPKWHFIMKNFLFWSLVGISIALGAVAFSIIIFAFKDDGMGLGWHLYNMRFKTVLEFFPIYWFVLLVIFLISSYFGVKHTKYGYKYKEKAVISLFIFISIFLGAVISIGGKDKFVEDIFARKMPIYKGIAQKEELIWERIEDGFFRGKILDNFNDTFELNAIGFDGNLWVINYEDAMLRGPIIVGNDIKVIGEVIDGNKIKAVEIQQVKGGKPQLHMIK